MGILKYGETFGEIISIKGLECEFFDMRIDRESIPAGKFVYEVRHDDECLGIPVELADRVVVNFWGTVISDVEIPLENNGRLYLEDDDFIYLYT